MKNKLIISGCSYSCHGSSPNPHANWTNVLRKKYHNDISQLSSPGQSNESITRNIYDYIVKFKPKDSLIICQLTYTHRMGWWHNIADKWIDYQHILPIETDIITKTDKENDTTTLWYKIKTADKRLNETMFPGRPDIVSSDEFYELNAMYLTWLKYVYNDTETFKNLMFKIDTLSSYVKESGNKIMFIYWPNINDKYQLNELMRRNFYNIDNEYSMLKWSTKNNLTDNTSHLSIDGNNIFSSLINSKINGKTLV
jgi:hypothetical protein